MLSTLFIGLFWAAVLFAPVAIIIAVMEAIEDHRTHSAAERRCDRFAEAAACARELNEEMYSKIRQEWEDEAEELERDAA